MSDSLRSHGLYSPWNSPGQITGVGSLSLLQGIFSTQGSNPGLLHCRRILYQLSYQGSIKLFSKVTVPLYILGSSNKSSSFYTYSSTPSAIFFILAIPSSMLRYFSVSINCIFQLTNNVDPICFNELLWRNSYSNLLLIFYNNSLYILDTWSLSNMCIENILS